MNQIEFRYREFENGAQVQDTTKIERVFKFDFRLYRAYTMGRMETSGAYIFKTIDNDSKGFKHKILKISTH